MANDFATGLSDFGAAVSDLFGAKGASASADSYDQAKSIALANAGIARQATNIKQIQEGRQIFKTIGAQRAGVGGAGFSEGGTALDLLRSSASEGALTKALTAEQGAITENSYAEQAGFYGGMAGAARSAGTADTIGGLLQIAGGASNLYSAGSKLLGGGGGTFADVNAATGTEAAGTSALGGTALSTAAVDTGIGAAVVADAQDIANNPGENAATFALGGFTGGGSVASAAGWIICTELHRQGRMPSRRYYGAAPAFLAYPERGKRGYYVWAIPSVRHLRAYPQSAYSRLMEVVFNCRSQYICDRKRRRRGTVAGAIAAHGLYAMCWAISWFVPKSLARWSTLYEEPRG